MATPFDINDPNFLLQLQNAIAAQNDAIVQPPVQGIEQGSMSMSMTEMPKSEKEIQAAIRQKFMESQAQQEEQIKQQKALLAKEMERQKQLGFLGRLDLRPFAQAAQQYGSTTAVVPTSAPTDRLDAIKQLQEQIQKGQRGLTQDQVNFLRTMMEDRRSAQAALSQGNQEIRVFENVSKKFDKPQQELADFYQAHDTLKSAIASGDVASIQSSLASYARMTGEKGVLTDQDIGRTISPTFAMSFANLRSKIFSKPTTPVPEETLKTLLKGIERLRKAAEDKTAERINAAERQTSTGPGLYKTYSKDLAAEARKIIRPHEMTEEEKLQKELEELKKVK